MSSSREHLLARLTEMPVIDTHEHFTPELYMTGSDDFFTLLSPAAAEQFLARALDTLDAHRLTWGCDTWTAEESYGALLAIRSVLTNVLAKRVVDGYYTLDYAKRVGRYILHDNAEKIYGF